MAYQSKIETALRELLRALKMEHDRGKPVRRSIFTIQKIRQARELLEEKDRKIEKV